MVRGAPLVSGQTDGVHRTASVIMDGWSGARPQVRVGSYLEGPGSDIRRQGLLKKLKTGKKKYFVLRSTSSSGPARLDYYDSEKKFKTNHPAKRSLHLYTCFNVNKKSDTRHHKFAIALYLKDDSFSIISESKEDQEAWLNLLLEYQNEYLPAGEPVRVHYEHVWQGVVKHKKPGCINAITGSYRLCLSDKAVSLVKVSEYQPSYTFQFSSIRRCGHSDNFYFMEVGRSSITGTGEIWMQVEDTSIAQSMHDAVLNEMAASRDSQPQDRSFRVRSNTSCSTVSQHRNTVIGDEYPPRKRAVSESHREGSPRRSRTHQRPQSCAQLAPDPAVLGSSPLSPFNPFLEEQRPRTDSAGSRTSRTSDMHLDSNYENTGPGMLSHENSFASQRSQTPEGTYSISETEEDEPSNNSAYLEMVPGLRSTTPSPTHSQGQLERSTMSGDYLPVSSSNSDYLPMTPGQQSGTPSPTRQMDRPGSENQEDGYMDMRSGSQISSPASTHSGYMDMVPGAVAVSAGQRTPTESSPGYMVMDGGRVRATAPIPIRVQKDPGYIDMGPASQPLPTVKEGGSGEAYLPMSPQGQSPVSSEGLKPAKVISYLSDDSMSAEFPKRAYSVGSRPAPKPTYRQHHLPEALRREPLDSLKSSSAPHLIVQKSRSSQLDTQYREPYVDTSSCASPLSSSIKSDDLDGFMEKEDFYRQRTASDSYGSRPRSSSFGMQFMQGHRPRASSYGQSSRGAISKLVAGRRTDSFESVRLTSQELSNKRRSQESLAKFSVSSSRNSSSDSLKKPPDEQKRLAAVSDYMDMGFDKRKTPSPNVHGIISPKPDPTGYVDMTLGASGPKSRGISPSSSSQSLGSSPASVGHVASDPNNDTKVVKASGKAMQQKQAFAAHGSQLKVSISRLQAADKRSPSSSGRESEDESYVPFQPGVASPGPDVLFGSMAQDFTPKDALGHPGIKVQHGYSRSYDSGIKSPDFSSTSKQKSDTKLDKISKSRKSEKHKGKGGDDGKHSDKHKHDKHRHEKSDKHKHDRGEKKKHEKVDKAKHDTDNKQSPKLDISKTKANDGSPAAEYKEMVKSQMSPGLERKIDFIPDSDLFSNKMYQEDSKVASPVVGPKVPDATPYMEYSPGFEIPVSPTGKIGGKTRKLSDVAPIMSAPPRVEREYCEIDLTPKVEKAIESDYMEADPRVDLSPQMDETPEETTPTAVSKESATFSYIDFDPATEKKEKKEDNTPIKAPTRVQSFISHDDSSIEQEMNAEIVKDVPDNHRDGVTDKSENVDKCGKVDKSGEADKCGKVDKSDISENIGCDSAKELDTKREEESSANCSATNVINKTEIESMQNNQNEEVERQRGLCKDPVVTVASDNKSVIDSLKKDHVDADKDAESKERSECKDKHESRDRAVTRTSSNDSGKIIIKSSLTLPSESDPVEDEGYVDLDFTPDLPQTLELKSHQRTSSSSSNNSDKSRKFMENVISEEEEMRFPENPRSYICEEEENIPKPETPVSYISDDSPTVFSEFASGKDPGSPFRFPGKSSSTGSSSGKLSSCGSISGTEKQRSKIVTGQNAGNNTPMHRQASAPFGSSFMVRSSEVQSGRTRKASGPPSFPSYTTGQGAGGQGMCKRSSQQTLEPMGQELQKQNSMPCMNVPLTKAANVPIEKGNFTEKLESFQDMGQRHSYTDLTSYEEMTFPGTSLSQSGNAKSVSQQQLTGAGAGSGSADAPVKLNYVELELGGSSENVDEKSPRVKSGEGVAPENMGTVPYAQIDYQKTESLKNRDVKFTL